MGWSGTARIGPRRAHVIGLGGRGMTGLAQMLVQRGFAVSGSARGPDPALDRLRRLGVRVHQGEAPGHVPRPAHLLVYGPEAGRDHPERLVAARQGVPEASGPQLLHRLLGRRPGVAVAGSRLATTAAAMTGWALLRAGGDPTVLLAAPAPQLGGWGRLGRGDLCLVEAVEGILPPSARAALLLDDGPPGSEAAWLARVAGAVEPGGVVLAGGAGPGVAAAVRAAVAPVEWLDLEPGADWWAADLREERGRYRFRAFRRGRFLAEVQLQVPGRRAVLGALGAAALAAHLGVPAPALKEALEDFAGVARQCEPRGSYRGVTLIDDEAADGPGEALATCRRLVGPRRLWAAIGAGVRPAPDGCDLAAADRVLILGGPPGDPRAVAGLDEALAVLDRHLEPGDVLLTLGSGDVGTIADAFLRRLPRDRHGR